jgi:hypothetical protein
VEGRMKNWFLKGAVILCCLNFAVGCATIIHGTTQEVHINSYPEEAEVWIDGSIHGKTPAKVHLARKNDYYLIIRKEGFEESSAKIKRETSGWLLANAVFGGLIGCALDYSSGGAYNLMPAKLNINLTQNGAELPAGKEKGVYEMPAKLELDHNFKKMLLDGNVSLMYRDFAWRESVIMGTGIQGFDKKIQGKFAKTSIYISEGDVFFMQIDSNIIYEIEVLLEQDKKLFLGFKKLQPE